MSNNQPARMSIFNGVTVFASELDCLTDAPDPYRSLMHYLHFLTVPLYLLSIYVLMFKTPNSLRDYRKYLLWHTVGNMVFEVYISIFMLPVTYLPHLVFRGAGILKYWNISGIVQFYLLVATLAHTGLSIIEMFKFRFDATMSEETLNKKVLHGIVVFFWILAVFTPVFGFSTTPICLKNQFIYKQELWKSSPDASIQIVCHTSVVSPPLFSSVFTPLMILIIIAILTAVIIIPHTFLTILARLEQLSGHFSKRTIELQKMLLISLFIQAAIHGIMLVIPIVTFVYTIIFSMDNNELAYSLLILISFHGSISTIAMIGFTKPIRIGVLQILGQLVPVLSPNRKLALLTPPSQENSSQSNTSIFMSRKIPM